MPFHIPYSASVSRYNPISTRRTGLAALLLMLAGACGPRQPRPIAFGEESCRHCHMTVADGRYAAEAITRTAKIHVFDDIACLTAWLAENGGVMASLWVADFAAPDQWLAADSAVYLQNDTVHTPMASGLAALRPGREADSVQALLGGRLRSWPEVLAMPHGHAPGLAR